MATSGYVTSKGQTTIPKEIRERLGLATGSRLEWTVDGETAVVRAQKASPAELAGCLGNPLGRIVTLDEMKRAVAEGVAERFERAVDRR